MGFLEAAVVIYLRELYYPNGFSFPLVIIEGRIASVEILREAATIIMLIGIAALTAQSFSQRFARFIFCFAVWDIFYYVFLKIFLNWPESFLTWDLLFLIPLPWTSPVIVPLMASLTMIVFALIILKKESSGWPTAIYRKEWTLLVSGSMVVIISFTNDFILQSENTTNNIFLALFDQKSLLNNLETYVPQSYDWWIFLTGQAIILLGIARYALRKT
ncbi:MAG: hypothetical protein DWQ44_05705 [Bacteroidetes bacterium]|nr:MAG: hypothetical protein DWQ33_01290 [Bacteroidota bacterium]REK03517.1 MAG: hypothetical protein DWQ39_09980 [Bacteroidota bacterium]REK34822.1 MAG: hypothetical protein DWQ44_05705 [Bacteroidota bacterium]REK51298.1 MAG: hypothetical protein DWQ48_01445 [Bacteroidota bacterium]